jgi:hypothetical protein
MSPVMADGNYYSPEKQPCNTDHSGRDPRDGGCVMTISPGRKPNYTPEIVVGIGYLLFLVLLVTSCGAALVLLTPDSRPTGTVPSTPVLQIEPTAHVLATPAPGDPDIFLDDFSSNANNWGRVGMGPVDARVTDGKLVVASKVERNYSVVTCGTCLSPFRPYYMQADFVTDAATDSLFGMVIRTHVSAEDFYLFGINLEARDYIFCHHAGGQWSVRAAGPSDAIRSFPANNTLGVYVSGEDLEFYINGKVVDTYQETGMVFERGLIGFYTEGTSSRIKVDNLLIDGMGE